MPQIMFRAHHMVEMARDVKSPHFLAIEIKLILPPVLVQGKLIFFYGCNPLYTQPLYLFFVRQCIYLPIFGSVPAQPRNVFPMRP